MKIKFKVVDKKIKTKLPSYATEHSSGLDLSSASMEDIVLQPMTTVLIPTNLIIEIPPGCEGQVRPRSGLALRHNIGIINSPGTIDADYRGEVKVILINLSNNESIINDGERICQMVVARHEKVEWEITEALNETERGHGGFGHTGI